MSRLPNPREKSRSLIGLVRSGSVVVHPADPDGIVLIEWRRGSVDRPIPRDPRRGVTLFLQLVDALDLSDRRDQEILSSACLSLLEVLNHAIRGKQETNPR